MAIDGRRTSIPISDVATVLELSAPDKMRVLNAGSDIERKIYQSMSWEERGGKYYGHGILREGALILSVSEVLTDTGSTSTATILVMKLNGGEGGIRTHDGLAPMPVFKTGAFNRSATSP